ncbi:unnamed protein product [Caenorhabditis bovis]|uniref:Uncharacterized protein n=1 Tax=Caenorhabditis bovis TaxID=2654633 RepID=A0A8S1ERW2_9PELO|nr:unnamed protein product [Caenorhabditis bovis]
MIISWAIPQTSVFWIAAERILYHFSETIREGKKSLAVSIFRLFVIISTIAADILLKLNFDSHYPSSNSTYDSADNESVLVNSLLHNYYFDSFHADSPVTEIYFLASRCALPIIFPLSFIILNKELRADYIDGLILCRKARNAHKESKVKVIATRESQESIIANLKMIGILSDIDGGPSTVSQSGPSTTSISSEGKRGSNGISRERTSTTSTGSGSRQQMMFTTRNNAKNSIPSVSG